MSASDHRAKMEEREFESVYAAVILARRRLINSPDCAALEVWQSTRRLYRETSAAALRSTRPVMVVEDDFILALLYSQMLTSAGWSISGPFSRVDVALEAVSEQPLMAAILDMNLADGLVFPLAQLLITKQIPFFFITGSDAQFPAAYMKCARLLKPAAPEQLLCTLGEVMWPENPSQFAG